MNEAIVKTAIYQNARREVLLCDSAKFGQESLVRFAGFSVTPLITDRRPEGALRQALEACVKIRVTVIITLTANPSLDRTIELGAPLATVPCSVLSVPAWDPGDQGVNISRAPTGSIADPRHCAR